MYAFVFICIILYIVSLLLVASIDGLWPLWQHSTIWNYLWYVNFRCFLWNIDSSSSSSYSSSLFLSLLFVNLFQCAMFSNPGIFGLSLYSLPDPLTHLPSVVSIGLDGDRDSCCLNTTAYYGQFFGSEAMPPSIRSLAPVTAQINWLPSITCCIATVDLCIRNVVS